MKANQPGSHTESEKKINVTNDFDVVAMFRETLVSIGGSVVEITDESEIIDKLSSLLPARAVTNVLNPNDGHKKAGRPHDLQNTDVAILRAEFGVAENGAIWITDSTMIDRALPFICLHLVLVIRKSEIVPTMHEAYEKIAGARYEFGTFIAGPSKTADIEQSLVLGAHGAKTMTCVIVSA